MIGLLQKIVYEDWLPELLGPEFFDKTVGRKQNYDENIDPSISSEFSVAAYRLGHSLVNDEIKKVRPNLQETLDSPLQLKDAFFRDANEILNDPNSIHQILLGLGTQLAETPDGHV